MRPSTLTALLAAFSCVPFIGTAEAQDRNIQNRIVFPAGAFSTQGGPVINIKDAPYNAKGDGVTDDTAAFKALMNFMRDEWVAARAAGKRSSRWSVYVPTGTYLVSDSLVHDGNLVEGFSALRLVGQDRRNTIIRLKNSSPGFGAGANKAVLPWTKVEDGAGGTMWGNELRNLTVDTGSGNPGAVGVLFLGANSCAIDNVTIRSGDGQGAIGLSFPTWSVQGHFTDITVNGFDIGIDADLVTENNPVLENITLLNQNVAGIRIGGAAACIRKLRSDNSVPAIVVNGTGAQLVLLDSDLRGTAPGGEAVRFHKSAAGAPTLHSGWIGRSRDNLGVQAIENYRVITKQSSGATQTVINETFNAGFGGQPLVQEVSTFISYRTVSEPTFQISWWSFIKGTLSTGNGGLVLELRYVPPASRTTTDPERFQVYANGVKIATPNLADDNWYKWEATWTPQTNGTFNLSLRVMSLGPNGTSNPTIQGPYTRTGITASGMSTDTEIFAGVQGRARDDTGVFRVDSMKITQ